MNCKRYFTGALAAFMVASSAFMAYADGPVTKGTDPAGLTSAPGETIGAGNETAGEAAETVAAAPAAEAQSSNTTVTAGGTTAFDNSAAGSGTVTAGSSTVAAGSGTVTAGSSTVAAGSGTVTAGGALSSGSTVTAGGQAGPVAGGSSGIITAGSGKAAGASSGPAGVVVPSVIGAGDLSFAGQLTDSIVKVVEKYSYDQMSRDISSLKSRYGSHMQVNTIATSLDGRSLYEIIIGNPNASKHILIHAGIHAREYMTPLLVMKQAEHLLAFYDSGSYQGRKLSDILAGVAIHIVPMVNPDGITVSQFGVSALRSADLRRIVSQCYAQDQADGRTTQSFERYQALWKANGRGVDLNQNFPALWDSITTGPSHASYANYKGTSALSEPESKALADLANSTNWTMTISYHSMGNLVYWDFAGNKVAEQSKALAELVTGITGYRTNRSSGKGGFKDYVQIKDSPIPSLTIEVGSVACPMPASEFGNVWNSNQAILAALAAYAADH